MRLFKKVCQVVALNLCVFASCANDVVITTSEWQPYIGSKEEEPAIAAHILEQVYSQTNTQVQWQYQNFDLAYWQVKQGQKLASFPWLKTAQREQEVLFSMPVFSGVSRIYFNRQRYAEPSVQDIQQARVGTVTGYQYGDEIDPLLADAEVFPSDQVALQSLLNNEIDFLPMTESVMNYLLNTVFSDQAQLILSMKDIEQVSTLHLIAAKSLEGLALVQELDQLLCQVGVISRYIPLQRQDGGYARPENDSDTIECVVDMEIKSLHPQPVARQQTIDTATLISAEGYPAIIGQTSKEPDAKFYALPVGTKVLVLQWSDTILEPANSDRVYRTMMDMSHVVVLNGPHVGLELYIKNMHIELL